MDQQPTPCLRKRGQPKKNAVPQVEATCTQKAPAVKRSKTNMQSALQAPPVNDGQCGSSSSSTTNGLSSLSTISIALSLSRLVIYQIVFLFNVQRLQRQQLETGQLLNTSAKVRLNMSVTLVKLRALEEEDCGPIFYDQLILRTTMALYIASQLSRMLAPFCFLIWYRNCHHQRLT